VTLSEAPEEGRVGGVPEPALGDEGGADEGGGETEAEQDLEGRSSSPSTAEIAAAHAADGGVLNPVISLLASITAAKPQRWEKGRRIWPEFGEEEATTGQRLARHAETGKREGEGEARKALCGS